MKFNFKKNNKVDFKKGMSYMELVIVISIFFIMSAVVLVKNDDFQKRIEVQNLTNEIALKIVQIQKDALSGKDAQNFGVDSNSIPYKPAYGVYMRAGDKNFTSFADYNNNNNYDEGEGLGSFYMNKGSVNDIKIVGSSCASGVQSLDELNIVFKRPDSTAILTSQNVPGCNFPGVFIRIASVDGSILQTIKVFSSGRIQLN